MQQFTFHLLYLLRHQDPSNEQWYPIWDFVPDVTNDEEDISVGAGTYDVSTREGQYDIRSSSDGIIVIVTAAVATWMIIFLINLCKKKPKTIMSLLLCVGFTGSMIANIPQISAEAAEYEKRIINAFCDISVDGHIITLKSSVTYNFRVENGNGNYDNEKN